VLSSLSRRALQFCCTSYSMAVGPSKSIGQQCPLIMLSFGREGPCFVAIPGRAESLVKSSPLRFWIPCIVRGTVEAVPNPLYFGVGVVNDDPACFQKATAAQPQHQPRVSRHMFYPKIAHNAYETPIQQNLHSKRGQYRPGSEASTIGQDDHLHDSMLGFMLSFESQISNRETKARQLRYG
jgi:hypothetical protein